MWYQSKDLSRQTDADKRPFYRDHQWWLPLENGLSIPGVLTSAPKKKDRVVLEFVLLNGRVKKFYRCKFCSSEYNRTEWIFHKNYVHQHIPRRHQNQCLYCLYCQQYIFHEIFSTHQKTCHKRASNLRQITSTYEPTVIHSSIIQNPTTTPLYQRAATPLQQEKLHYVM